MTTLTQFEEYLREIHAKGYTGLDDDMPEAFERWLANLDNSEIINYAETALHQQREMMRKEASESRKQTLKELILEQQANELEGKGYDFYFNIRTKLDDLLSNKETKQ